MYRWLIVFCAVCVAPPGTVDAAVAVDGDLADWGISMGAYGHMRYDSQYVGKYQRVKGPGITHTTGSSSGAGVVQVTSAPVIDGRTIYFAMEDTNDHRNGYTVGPLLGGQNYDAEFLGVSQDTNADMLYVAISSGQRPDNGWAGHHHNKGLFAPGDLVLWTQSGDVLGLELGGGEIVHRTNRVTYTYNEGSDGYTYDLNSSGYTTGTSKSSGGPMNADQVVGSLWATNGKGYYRNRAHSLAHGGDWTTGISSQSDVITQLIGGDRIGGSYLADVTGNYGFDSDGTSLAQHAWIEVGIDLTQISYEKYGDITKVQWSPACANDQLLLTVDLLPPAPPVPEPASVVVWGVLGLIGVACARLRRRRR